MEMESERDKKSRASLLEKEKGTHPKAGPAHCTDSGNALG